MVRRCDAANSPGSCRVALKSVGLRDYTPLKVSCSGYVPLVKDHMVKKSSKATTVEKRVEPQRPTRVQNLRPMGWCGVRTFPEGAARTLYIVMPAAAGRRAAPSTSGCAAPGPPSAPQRYRGAGS